MVQKSQSYSPSPLASTRCPQDRCLLPSLSLKPAIANETHGKEQMLRTLVMLFASFDAIFDKYILLNVCCSPFARHRWHARLLRASTKSSEMQTQAHSFCWETWPLKKVPKAQFTLQSTPRWGRSCLPQATCTGGRCTRPSDHPSRSNPPVSRWGHVFANFP